MDYPAEGPGATINADLEVDAALNSESGVWEVLVVLRPVIAAPKGERVAHPMTPEEALKTARAIATAAGEVYEANKRAERTPPH